MAEAIVLPPTPAILDLSRLLSQVISRFLQARKTIRKLGEYEADREGLVLMYLVIRYVEGVIALAERDLVLLPSAMVLTRSAFETATRGRWMLDPRDSFEREARWLVHLKGQEEYLAKLDAELRLSGRDGSKFAKQRQEFESFRMAVTALLPKQVSPLKQLPNLREMLRSIGEEGHYGHYVILSNYTHGSYVASWTFRRNLGTYTEIGEFIKPEEWEPCFSLSWFSLASLGQRVLERLNGNPAAFVTNDLIDEVKAALDKIKPKTS